MKKNKQFSLPSAQGAKSIGARREYQLRIRTMLSCITASSMLLGTTAPGAAFAQEAETDSIPLIETERTIDFGAKQTADAIMPEEESGMAVAQAASDVSEHTDQAAAWGASEHMGQAAAGNVSEHKEQPSARERIVIADTDDLDELAQRCMVDTSSENLDVVLTDDITYAGKKFTPIPFFSGTFDGQGHTISGIMLQSAGSAMGLFRYIGEGAVVRNLNAEGRIEPEGSAQSLGGIAGDNAGIIQNCSFKGSIRAQETGGGIAGVNEATGLISCCSFDGEVVSQHRAGGICGENAGGVIGCANEGSINTQFIETDVQTKESLAENLTNLSDFDVSSVSAEDFVDIMDIGGICGYSEGLVTECRNTGAVGYAHTGYNVGGICGRSCGFTAGCTNEGTVSGRKDVGGIVGQLEPESIWAYSHNRIQDLKDQLNTLNSLIDNVAYDVSGSSEEIRNRIHTASAFAHDTIENLEDVTDEIGFDVETVSASISSMMGQLQSAVNEQDAEGIKSALSQLAGLISTTDFFRLPIYVSVKGDTNSDLETVLNARENEWWKKLDEYLNGREHSIGSATVPEISLPSGEASQNLSLPTGLTDPESAQDVIPDAVAGAQDLIQDIVQDGNMTGGAADPSGTIIPDGTNPVNPSGTIIQDGTNPVDLIIPDGSSSGGANPAALIVPDGANPTGGSAVSDRRSGQEVISDGETAIQNKAEEAAGSVMDEIESPIPTGVVNGNRVEGDLFSPDASAADEDYSAGMFTDTPGADSGGEIVSDDAGAPAVSAGGGAVVSDGGTPVETVADFGENVLPEESILTGSGMEEMNEMEGLIVPDSSEDDVASDAGGSGQPALGGDVSTGNPSTSGTTLVDYHSDLNGNRSVGDLLSSDANRNSNVKVDVDADLPDTAVLRALLHTVLKDAADLLDPAAIENAEQILKSLQITAPDTEAFYDHFQKLAGSIEPIADAADSMTEETAADIDALTDQMNLVIETFFDLTDSLTADDLDERYQKTDISEQDPYQSDSSSIERCSNTGQVDGDSNIGGICGCIGFENKIDAEGVLDVSDYLLKDAKYTVFAALRRCMNTGAVTAKKEAAGGICGCMEFGIVTDSSNTGAVSTGEGDYCGGISGQSKGTVTLSCAGSLLSGNAYVGGITGMGTNVRDCISYSYIGGGTEYLGAVAGKAEGKVTGCKYVDYGIGGIDNIGYAGVAEPAKIEDMQNAPAAAALQTDTPAAAAAQTDTSTAAAAQTDTSTAAAAQTGTAAAPAQSEVSAVTFLPQAMGSSCTVTFLVEDEVFQTEQVPFGGSLEKLPEVPNRGTDYWVWDDFDREHIFSSQTVTGSYHRATTTLSSGGDVPDYLAEGVFYEGQELSVSRYTLPESPVSTESFADLLEIGIHGEGAADPLPEETETEAAGGKLSRAKARIEKVITDKLTGPLIDARTLSVNDYEEDLTVRAKLPAGGRLFTGADGGALQETDYQRDGSYIVFAIPNGGSFAYYETLRQNKDMRGRIAAVCAAAGAAAVLLIFWIHHRKHKTKGHKTKPHSI